MAGVNKLLKEAQKMQAKLQAAKADLASQSFQASVAGGAVQATVNGDGQLTALQLDAEFLKEDPAMVAQSIVSAVSQAQGHAAKAGEEMMGLMGGAFKGLMG